MILHRTPLVALLATKFKYERSPGFRIAQTKLISPIPEFLFLYMGR